ncbi:MAG: flagellar biosynthesis anti-sigma factor FlgM [Nitrospirae bacterium YQR-1]
MKIYGNKPPETTEIGGGTRKTVKTSKEKDTTTGKATGDMVNISGGGRAIEEIRNTLTGLPETRDERVAAVSSAIKDGTYKVSPENIASKMLQEMM